MEAVAAGDRVALEHLVAALVAEAESRPVALGLLDGNALDLEQERQPGVEPRRDQVLHHLGLAVEDDRASGQLAHRHVVALALELEVDAAVDDPLAVEALADSRVAQEVGGALLEHARTEPVLDVVARAVLEHDRLDALAGEQLRERQACRARADDPDLGPQGQNGNGCGAPTVIQCVSVNSSITALPPKRPIPLSLTPPNGICGSSPTGWSFTWTMPAWMRCASRIPRSVSLVMIPDDEAVSRRVRAVDGLVGAVDDVDRRDRAERLEPREVRVGGHVRQQRRPVDGALRLAAREHLRALRDRVVDAALHQPERVLGDERPDDRVGLSRVAGLQPLRSSPPDAA